LISWLKNWGYEVKDSTKDNKIQGIEFQAQIKPQLPITISIWLIYFLVFGISKGIGLLFYT
jgi:bacteriorhodopsin